jgi:hypothetical protein
LNETFYCSVSFFFVCQVGSYFHLPFNWQDKLKKERKSKNMNRSWQVCFFFVNIILVFIIFLFFLQSYFCKLSFLLLW